MLLTHKQSVSNIERHVHILTKLATNLENGILFSDINTLSQILSVCFERIDANGGPYAECTAAVTAQLTRPWVGPTCKPADIVPLISTLVKMLTSPIVPIAATATRVLVHLHEGSLAGHATVHAAFATAIPGLIATTLPAMCPASRAAMFEVSRLRACAPDP